MKIERKIDEIEYVLLHDVILEASDSDKSLSNEELDELIEILPANIKGEAFAWGFNDTCVRDQIYVWYQSELMEKTE